MSGKFGCDVFVNQSGLIFPEIDIDGDAKIRLITTNAAPSNVIVLYGRIAGQSYWTIAGSVVGTTSIDIPVKYYDFIRIECTNYATQTAGSVRLVGSGFTPSIVSFDSITTPNGVLTSLDTLEFTTSDNSVILTPTAPNIIDIKAVAQGSTKYNRNIIVDDWLLVGSDYTITILSTLHGVQQPSVTCYELVGSDYLEVSVPVKIDTSNNIVISTSQNPDLRFAGKIIVE